MLSLPRTSPVPPLLPPPSLSLAICLTHSFSCLSDSTCWPSTVTAGSGDGGSAGSDWQCASCGNLNYSFRTTCNMRKCGAPKPTTASAAPAASLPAVTPLSSLQVS